jgi:hypothetical protein
MTENQLAVVENEKPMVPTNHRPTGVKLETLDEMFRFAEIALKGGFAPKGINTREAAFLALEMGAELGLQPMQALQSIGVINGRPAPFGNVKTAIVLNSGLCEEMEEWFEDDEGRVNIPAGSLKDFPDDFAAVVKVRRKGRKAAREGRFSVGDAKRANLWGKQGPWSQYPQRMLRFRALGFVLDDEFSDILRGFTSYEELQDYPEVAFSPSAKPTPKVEVSEVVADEGEAEDDGIWQDEVDQADTSILRARLAWFKENDPDHPEKAAVVVELRKRKLEQERKERAAKEATPKRTLHDAVAATRPKPIESEAERREVEGVFGESDESNDETGETSDENEDEAVEGAIEEVVETEPAPLKTKGDIRRAFIKAVADTGFTHASDSPEFLMMLNGCLTKNNYPTVEKLQDVQSGIVLRLKSDIEAGDLKPAAMMYYPEATEVA